MIKKVGLTVATVAGVLMAPLAFAAVDNDVSAAANTVATTLKDNTVGVIGDNVNIIILAGVLILAITVMWRLAKRFLRG